MQDKLIEQLLLRKQKELSKLPLTDLVNIFKQTVTESSEEFNEDCILLCKLIENC